MKDIVWVAVLAMLLAALAVFTGIVSLFSDDDLLPLVQGLGLASVAFAILGLRDRS